MEKKEFIYMQIYNDLKEKIESGQLKPGEKILPEYELIKEYSVSRDTLRKALGKLELDGYISRKAAKGTYVKHQKADYPLSRMESFSEQMRKRGAVPSSEILSIKLTDEMPDSVRESLKAAKNDKVCIISRIRKADGQPMAYEVSYISLKVCPDIHTHVVDNTSLYEVYENIYGLKMNHGEISLEAELPTEKVQRLLKISNNEPVLKMSCGVTLDDGSPLYYVYGYYIGEKYRFTTTLPR